MVSTWYEFIWSIFPSSGTEGLEKQGNGISVIEFGCLLVKIVFNT
jgi:hypothetical protein